MGLDYVGDLGKFDQGLSMDTNPEITDLIQFGKSVLMAIPATAPLVKVTLDILPSQPDTIGNIHVGHSGPSQVMVDPTVLKRVLNHLLANAADYVEEGSIQLRIGYNSNNRLTFCVTDTGPGLEMAPDAADGDLPTVFQKYHQEVIPKSNESIELEEAATLRDKIEQRISSHKRQGLGVGLALTYHLVQELGGELRCSSIMGQGTTFWFSLPKKVSDNTTTDNPNNPTLTPMTINVGDKIKSKDDYCMPDFAILNHPADGTDQTMISGLTEPPELGGGGYGGYATMTTTGQQQVSGSTSDDASPIHNVSESSQSKRKRPRFQEPIDELPEISMSNLACIGIKAQDPPNVLVVEDTKSCAKLYTMLLAKFNISSQVAENGKQAIDLLMKSTPGTFDMVLMDLRMPVMDGLEATNIIKNDLGMDIPVIAVTGDDSEDTLEACNKIGFDEFQSKPLKRDVLKDIVKKYTGYQVNQKGRKELKRDATRQDKTNNGYLIIGPQGRKQQEQEQQTRNACFYLCLHKDSNNFDLFVI